MSSRFYWNRAIAIVVLRGLFATGGWYAYEQGWVDSGYVWLDEYFWTCPTRRQSAKAE